MAMGSRIEWTEATWNPVTGCTPVSPGCLNCYAARMALRLASMPNGTGKKYRGTAKRARDGRAVFTGRINLAEEALVDDKQPGPGLVDHAGQRVSAKPRVETEQRQPGHTAATVEREQLDVVLDHHRDVARTLLIDRAKPPAQEVRDAHRLVAQLAVRPATIVMTHSDTIAGPSEQLVFAALKNLTDDAIANRSRLLHLILIGPETGEVDNFYEAKSSDDSEPTTRPELVIDYTPPPGWGAEDGGLLLLPRAMRLCAA